MGAAEALQALRQDGFTLSAAGGRLIVAPASKLSDGARALIRQHRDDLLLIVSGTAQTGLDRPHGEPANDPGPGVPPELIDTSTRARTASPTPYENGTVDRARAARVNRMAMLNFSIVRTERVADRLAQRDDDGDDRRMCVECSHLGDRGRCLAAAAGRLPGAGRRLEPVPDLLQRCEAFGLRKGLL